MTGEATRYAPPTQAEREEIFSQGPISEQTGPCAHRKACRRVLRRLDFPANPMMIERALGCAACEERGQA